MGLPTRPKSPTDSKKESDGSTLYSSLPSSDAPDHGVLGNRTQVNVFTYTHIQRERESYWSVVNAVSKSMHVFHIRLVCVFVDD